MWKDKVVGVAELGRSADKYTQTSSAMFKLEEQATALLARLRPHRPYFPQEFKRAKEGKADRDPFTAAVAPKVIVRASKVELLKMLGKLDQSSRLMLMPRNGWFAVYKDEDNDRLILDARPPNRKEARKSSVPLAALLGEATLTASQAFT
ncbi:unnamed protein product [Polarella glacialis]|uniref:Uncharacterized protein n=1 Tax=Polarella glacialis TaxID=89957 RepID=A0A813GCV4_POLGL|nr:unnamed protein product [Polarella glacialis]